MHGIPQRGTAQYHSAGRSAGKRINTTILVLPYLTVPSNNSVKFKCLDLKEDLKAWLQKRTALSLLVMSDVKHDLFTLPVRG